MTDLLDVLSPPESTCFACGAARRGVVSACPSCRRKPDTIDELRQALAASGYESTATAAKHNRDSRLDNPVFRAVRQRALENILSDQQLHDLLGLRASPAGRSSTHQPKAVLAGSAGAAASSRRRPRATALDCNPFYVLGASSVDPVQSLPTRASTSTRDGDTLEVSSAVLLDSNSRLSAELSWLGDVTIDDAKALMDGTQLPESLTPLGRLNLGHWHWVSCTDNTATELAKRVRELSKAFDLVDSEAVCRELNASRRQAGVQALADGSEIDAALKDRMSDIVGSIVATLDTLPADTLLQSFELFCPAKGRVPGRLMHALIAHYWRFAEPVLLSEGDKVVALCRRGATTLHNGDGLAIGFAPRLAQLLSLHQRLMRPLQTSPALLGELRTSTRLMHEAFHELIDASELDASAECDALIDVQQRFFEER